VLGDYNKSIICFENTLKIQPDFEAAAKRKHAVMCHQKLEAALEAQHRYEYLVFFQPDQRGHLFTGMALQATTPDISSTDFKFFYKATSIFHWSIFSVLILTEEGRVAMTSLRIVF
jgi:hypothetical protein